MAKARYNGNGSILLELMPGDSRYEQIAAALGPRPVEDVLRRYAGEFDESKHPRGNEENAGQFAEKPGGAKSGEIASAKQGSPKKVKKPSKKGESVRKSIESIQTPTQDVLNAKMAELQSVVYESLKSGNLSPVERERFNSNFQRILSGLSAGTIAHLGNNIKAIKFYKTSNDLLDSLKGLPGVEEKRLRGVNGIYSVWDRSILLLSSHSPDTLAHEMSHSLEGPGDHDGAIQPSYSWENAWEKAWEEEISKGRLSEYAKTNKHEGWAEFGRLLMSDDPQVVRLAHTLFPKCLAFWKSKGLVK